MWVVTVEADRVGGGDWVCESNDRAANWAHWVSRLGPVSPWFYSDRNLQEGIQYTNNKQAFLIPVNCVTVSVLGASIQSTIFPVVAVYVRHTQMHQCL